MKRFLAAFLLVFLVGGSAEAATISLMLSWTDTANNEDGFNVERGSVQAGPFTQIGQTAANVVAFTDGPLQPNTQYCYRVNAYNQAGVSGYTNVACATTPALPSDPNNLTIQLQVK